MNFLTKVYKSTGSALSTQLIIRNYTNQDIKNIYVTNIDDFDWFNKKPDDLLNGKRINKGGELYTRLDCNSLATWCPLKVTLYYQDDTDDYFRVNILPAATRKGSYDFDVHSSQHEMTLTELVHDHRIIVTIKEFGAPQNSTDRTTPRTGGQASVTIGTGGVSVTHPI